MAGIDASFKVKQNSMIDEAIEEVLGGYSSQESESITRDEIIENIKKAKRKFDVLERERLKAFLGFNVVCSGVMCPDEMCLFVGKNVWDKLQEIREEESHE